MADPVVLFSVDDARAFDQQQLTDESAFPDAAIEAARDRITQAFRQICGVSFVPVSETSTMNGDGSRLLAIVDSQGQPIRKLISIDALSVRFFNTVYEFSADELAGVRIMPGGILWRDWLSQALDSHIYGFGYGIQTVTVTYTHGYAEPPAEIVWAALKLLVHPRGGLITSDMPDGATMFNSAAGSFSLATAGTARNQFSIRSIFGVPTVDEIVRRYSERAGTIS
ncbi:MAG TPA: hypothetical protein VKU87_08965 [Thermomicrobiaceae bacterium]|nr:hypothetical protein [Thermomicrobiaceae bacterium]